jgi:hypothetical protein
MPDKEYAKPGSPRFNWWWVQYRRRKRQAAKAEQEG